MRHRPCFQSIGICRRDVGIQVPMARVLGVAGLSATLALVTTTSVAIAQDTGSAPVMLDDSTISYSAAARPGTTIIVPLPSLKSIAFDPDDDALAWALSDDDAIEEHHGDISLSGDGDRWALAFSIGSVVPAELQVDLVLREESTEQHLESDDRVTVVLSLTEQ